MNKNVIEIDGHEVKVQQDQIAKFQTDVESIVEESGLTYVDAIVDYCEHNNIELETVKNLMSPSLLRKVTHEAKKLNLIDDDTGVLPLG